MFGDDDPDIAPFFAKFLGEGPASRVPPPRRDGRVRKPRYTADIAPLTNGLAIGLAGAAAILEETAAPRVRVRSERAELFHQMLEDMANDIMENGVPRHVQVMSSREETPRSSASTPPVFPGWPVEEPAEPLPQCLPLLVPGESDEADQLEQSSVDSSDEGTPRFPPTDFGASIPVPDLPQNHIRLVVSSSCEMDHTHGLWPSREVLAKINVDLDSSVEDLFKQIESKIGEHDIPSFITRSGLKLERADIPVKWSGLKDGDVITAMRRAKPSVEQRLFEVVTASKRLPGPDTTPVSMGAFGDTIVQVADETGTTGAYPSTRVTSTMPPLPSHWGEEDAGSELPDHWGGMGLTAAIQSAELDLNVVPPIPPDDEAFDENEEHCMPTSPDCMPDEFEELPADAFITPHSHAGNAQGASQQLVDSVSPSKPRPPHKVAASPMHSTSQALEAATPTSSRLSDLSYAPTPSRRTVGPQGKPRAGAEEFKKNLEEKQKQNDAIWANIAATLEPGQQRTFLSHTLPGSGLGKKFPPMARRQLQ